MRGWVGWLLVCAAVLGWSGVVSAQTAQPAELAGDAALRKAYQREFAFLEAEKRNLTRRLAELDAEEARKVAVAEKELRAAQGESVALATQADRLMSLLEGVEREAESSGESEELLEGVLSQLSAMLEKRKASLPAEADAPVDEKLSAGFSTAFGLLKQAGSVRKEPGEFFLPNGEAVAGELVRVGSVASYGTGPQGGGVLVPAGAGRLKLWASADDDGQAVAESLAKGQAPATLPIFIYENLDKGIEEKKAKTAFEIVQSGGVIGWVIVAGGVLVLVLALLRAGLIWRNAANTDRLVGEVSPLVERGRVDEALAVCQRVQNSPGRVLAATLRNLGRPREELEDIVSESVLHETPQLDRFGSTILMLAAVAPLLGLLGTVTGMIATFDIITEFGTGNPKLLSGGISVALVTTELGLIVAIPALLLGNLLGGWASRIKDDMDRAALRVINISAGAKLKPPLPGEPDQAPTAAPAVASA